MCLRVNKRCTLYSRGTALRQSRRATSLCIAACSDSGSRVRCIALICKSIADLFAALLESGADRLTTSIHSVVYRCASCLTSRRVPVSSVQIHLLTCARTRSCGKASSGCRASDHTSMRNSPDHGRLIYSGRTPSRMTRTIKSCDLVQ